MTPQSLATLRRIRDRLDRSFHTHPEFRVRLAFGIRTSSDLGDGRWTDHRQPIQAGPHHWTWEDIGDHLGIKDLVTGRHSRIKDFRRAEFQSGERHESWWNLCTQWDNRR